MKSLFTKFFTLFIIPIPLVKANPSEEEVMLSPVVVSASHIPTPLEKTPGNVTIITREEIAAKNALSTIDLLRQIPSLHIDQLGGRGGISSVYLRGSDPNFTLVLIDGIKVNDPTNSRGGTFDFSTLAVNQIERIEMIYGPLSAVYGSEALGGVVHIITRQGTDEPKLFFKLEGGLYGYYHTDIESTGPLGEIGDYALNIAYTDNGEIVEDDEFQSQSLHWHLNLFPSDQMGLKWVVRYVDNHAESFPSDSGGSKWAVIRQLENRDIQEWTTGMELDYAFSSHWDSLLKVNWHQHQEQVHSQGVAPGLRDPFGLPASDDDNTFDRTHLSLNNFLTLSEQLSLSVGVEAQLEQGISDNILYLQDFPLANRFEIDRNTYSSFLEIQYALLSGLNIQGGLRVDVPEGFGTEISPRLGLLYPIKSTQTTLKANWGQGFKLPSFFALANPIVGNPNLRPESSESIDIGFIHKIGNQRITVSNNLFYNRFFDIIDFDNGPPPQLVNRSEVVTKGVDFNLAMMVNDQFSITPHLTYVKTDIKGTDEVLRNRPEWRGGLKMEWQPQSNMLVHLDVLHVGKNFDSSIPTGDLTLDPYQRVDMNAIWTLNPHLQVILAIDNLFDTDYEESIGFQSPGVQFRLSTRIQLLN